MAITVSKSNNITSPEGNSLAVYNDNQPNQFTVKDIYGKTETLFLGTGNVSGSGTTNTISLLQMVHLVLSEIQLFHKLHLILVRVRE